MTHHLTESDCEALRTQLLAKADESAGTSAYQPWIDAVELLDQARSKSFRTRCQLPAEIRTDPPAATPRKTPALATAADAEL